MIWECTCQNGKFEGTKKSVFIILLFSNILAIMYAYSYVHFYFLFFGGENFVVSKVWQFSPSFLAYHLQIYTQFFLKKHYFWGSPMYENWPEKNTGTYVL
jgi:hypothetical protein